jgi:two-component system cell cycle response regulator
MKRLVHVDNSDFFRKVVERFLASEGLVAEGSKTATGALELIKEGDVSLVVTGTVLADMDGSMFIKLCNIMSPDIPILVLSSNPPEREMEKLSHLKIEAILEKANGWQKNIRPYLDKYFGED